MTCGRSSISSGWNRPLSLEDAKQGQRLQELLGFRQKYIYSTVPAQVIGTGGSDQSRILTIDKGSKDGLKRDQPVITPDGIVGKLVEVFPHTSQVMEINDQTSGAGVLLEKTRMRGVLRGNAYGQPQIINVLPDDRVKPGRKSHHQRRRSDFSARACRWHGGEGGFGP